MVRQGPGLPACSVYHNPLPWNVQPGRRYSNIRTLAAMSATDN